MLMLLKRYTYYLFYYIIPIHLIPVFCNFIVSVLVILFKHLFFDALEKVFINLYALFIN